MYFSTLPTVAEGFQLKNWRGGPQAGHPKLSPVARGLLAGGLMRLDASQRLPRLFFTEAGLAELHRMMADRRIGATRTRSGSAMSAENSASIQLIDVTAGVALT
jgi:hypothetical protein